MNRLNSANANSTDSMYLMYLLHVSAYNISHFHKRAALFFPSSLFPDLPFLRCRYQFHTIHPVISKSRTSITAPPNLEVLPTSTSTFHFSTLSHLSTSTHLPNPNLSLTTPSPIHSPHPQDIPNKKPIKSKIPPKKKEKPPKISKNATKKSQLHHRQRQQTRRSPNDSLVDSRSTHIAECGFGRNSRDD